MLNIRLMQLLMYLRLQLVSTFLLLYHANDPLQVSAKRQRQLTGYTSSTCPFNSSFAEISNAAIRTLDKKSASRWLMLANSRQQNPLHSPSQWMPTTHLVGVVFMRCPRFGVRLWGERDEGLALLFLYANVMFGRLANAQSVCVADMSNYIRSVAVQ